MRKVESAREGQKIRTETSTDKSTTGAPAGGEQALCGKLSKNVGLSHSIGSTKATNGYQ